MISFFSRKERKVKNFLIDLDAIGGTAEECARAIQKSLKKLVSVEVELLFLTADSGGGGSCHNVHPKLIQYNIMPPSGKKAPFMLHVWQRAYANGMVAVYGEGGLGVRSLLQLLHSCNNLRKCWECSGVED